VPVWPGDTEQTLAARVLEQEHRIYPQAVRQLLTEVCKTPSSPGAAFSSEEQSDVAGRGDP